MDITKQLASQVEEGLKALRETVDADMGKKSAEAIEKIEKIELSVKSSYDALEKAGKEQASRVKDLEDQIYSQTTGASPEAGEVKSFNFLKKNVGSNASPMSVEQYKLYKSSFEVWMRKGLTPESFQASLQPEQQKAIQEATDGSGGYLVPADYQAAIEKILIETSPIRQLADVQTISRDRWEMPFDSSRFGVQRTSESATESNTSTPNFKLVKIPVFPRIAKPAVTGEMLEDPVFNMESYIRETASEDISAQENTDFVAGDGVDKARGFLSYPSGTAFGQIQQSATATAGTLAWSDLLTLLGGLKTGYHAGASLVLNRTAWFNLLKEESTAGSFKFSFGANGIAINGGAKPGFNFLGYPVVLFEDMPAVATGSLSVALADWKKAYKIIDRSGVSILRDPFTGGDNVTIFRMLKRSGGGVYNSEAIKLLVTQ